MANLNSTSPGKLLVVAYLLVIGLVSILGQVVILRELNVAFYGVELVYILAMGTWLIGSAAGALVGRREYIPRGEVLPWILVALAVLLPLELVFVRGVRVFFGGTPGAYLPIGQQAAALLLAVGPLSGLLGLLFQWAARSFISPDRSLARAYAIESAGGVLGGLLSTGLLALGVQNFSLGILCSTLMVATVISRPGISKRSRLGFSVLGVLSAAALWVSPWLDSRLTAINHPDLVESRDSPYSRITVSQRDSQWVVFENDVPVFETGSVEAEELVHAAALHCNRMENVLLLGGAASGYLGEILKFPVSRVDLVELNPVLLDVARTRLPARFGRDLQDPRVELHLQDPRRFLHDSRFYDLIIVGMPDPDSGQSNRFYTRDFFELCRASVANQGILSLRLSASENILTRFAVYREASIYQALSSVFQDVQILPGMSHVFLASGSRLERDPEALGQRWTESGVRARLFSPQYIRYLYTNDRFVQIADQLESSRALPNTDARPVCYPFASLIWLSKFFPALTNFEPGDWGEGSNAPILGGFLAVLLLVWLARRRFRFVLLVLVAGFVGMVLESMFLLQYQIKTGVLYQNIGLLLTVFMCGLTVGAWCLDIRSARTRPMNSAWGGGICAGFLAVSLSFLALQWLGAGFNLLTASALLFAVGFFVAAAFSYAAFRSHSDQRKVVSQLYAADLAGGCLGSLLASLLLIPFWGVEQSSMLAAVLAIVALLLV